MAKSFEETVKIISDGKYLEDLSNDQLIDMRDDMMRRVKDSNEVVTGISLWINAKYVNLNDRLKFSDKKIVYDGLTRMQDATLMSIAALATAAHIDKILEQRKERIN